MRDCPYDMVLYGATGFTGKQAAQYVARRVLPGALRWAIAGRPRQAGGGENGARRRRRRCRGARGRQPGPCRGRHPAAQTRVLLNTAVFARYGDPIVAAACVPAPITSISAVKPRGSGR